jgi:hypothetical protein
VTRSATLWIAAVAGTLAAGAWQRRTGPSYPFRTQVPLGAAGLRVSLPRSHPTSADASVTLPAPHAGMTGTLFWRRYPTSEPFTAVPLRGGGGTLAAALPAQPPAGKVEYYLMLTADSARVRVPSEAGETVILRFQGRVPLLVLVPHIAAMFLAMLLGLRAGLGAALEPRGHGTLTILTLVTLTLGGFILGPVTQKYAFDAFWTGVPFGWDLTDNKTLVAWIGWATASLAVMRRWQGARGLVVAASAVMIVIFAVPHSLRGSQLDYTRKPSPPPEAVGPQREGLYSTASTKQVAAIVTMTGPLSRPSAAAAYVPSTVESTATAIETVNMPVRLRASRRAVAAGMMTSDPINSTPR